MEECLVWYSGWSQLCQFVLLGVVLLCLYLKWSSEQNRRTVWDFYTDVSKQMFGSLFLHWTNMKFSDIVRQVTGTGDQGSPGDNCDWYLVSILLDCTLGSWLMIWILKAVYKLMTNYPNAAAEWIQEGDYKYSGIQCNRPRRIKQIVFWVCIPVFVARMLVVGLMCFSGLSGNWLTTPIHWLTGPYLPHLSTASHVHIREFITLVIVPMPFNIYQFWYLDKHIKRPRKLPPRQDSDYRVPVPVPVPAPVPVPLPDPTPLIDKWMETESGVRLSLDSQGRVSHKELEEFFLHADARRFYGLECYEPADITSLVEKMMSGAQVINTEVAGHYMACQLNNARMWAVCNTSGGDYISEEDFCNFLLSTAILDITDPPLVPRAFRALFADRGFLQTRTCEVVDNTLTLWENHIIWDQSLRLDPWLWRSRYAHPGENLELGLLVRPHGRAVRRLHGGNRVMGMIVDQGRPNHGAWMEMWNSVDVWVKLVEAQAPRDLSPREREDLGRQAKEFYDAVVHEFGKVKAHGEALPGPSAVNGKAAVNTRAFLTYFQQFMPRPSDAW